MSKLPFATDNGYFNGDMFDDWYRSEPKDEDKRLWSFLHAWESNVRTRAEKDTIENIETYVAQLKGDSDE